MRSVEVAGTNKKGQVHSDTEAQEPCTLGTHSHQKVINKASVCLSTGNQVITYFRETLKGEFDSYLRS